MFNYDQWKQDGLDIGGGWTAYGYILYSEDGDYRISLDTRICPGDGEDSISDWMQHLGGEFGAEAATAFGAFVCHVFRDPWPPDKAAIRQRLIEAGVSHASWRHL